MKMNKIIFFSFVFLINSVISFGMFIEDKIIFWDDLSKCQKDSILNKVSINSEAIDFYNGKFKFADNDKCIKLLNIITSELDDENIVIFYFHIFNMICLNADGASSEILGKYCQKIILNYPLHIITYFEKNKKVQICYANMLGYEFYFKEQGTSDMKYNFNDFKNILIKDCILSSKQSVLKMFFQEIENSMKNME